MSQIIRRILVPVDFTEHSEHATWYACELAARIGARIELLHVVEDPFISGAWSPGVYLGPSAEMLESILTDAENRLERAASAVAESGVRPQYVVLRGHPAQSIVEHARTGDADLIVMGTHGRTGLSHLLLGSVAERTLRTAACPVLTIKLTPATARVDNVEHAAAAA